MITTIIITKQRRDYVAHQRTIRNRVVQPPFYTV